MSFDETSVVLGLLVLNPVAHVHTSEGVAKALGVPDAKSGLCSSLFAVQQQSLVGVNTQGSFLPGEVVRQ